MEARSRTSGEVAGGRIEIREAARRPSLDGSRGSTAGPGTMLRCDNGKGREQKKACLVWGWRHGLGWLGDSEEDDGGIRHHKAASTAWVDMFSSSRPRGLGTGWGPIEWTLDAGHGRRDEKRMSTEEGGRDDGVLDAVWPCRWRRGTLSRWVAVAAGCHGMPAAGPPWAKATSSRLFGGWDAAHAGRVVCEGQEDTRWRWWYSARPRGRWRGLLEEARRPTGAKHTGTQPARLWLKSNGRYQGPHRLGGKNERTRTENDQPPSGQV